MFSKDSSDEDLTTATPSEDLPKGPPPRATPGVPSIISADLKIVGDLHSNGDIQIDGTVEGDIASQTVTVGEGAVVKGALVAEDVRVYGSIFGQVKANSVVLAPTAKVEGDIAHQSLSMEAGASLIGSLSRLAQGIGASAQPAAAAPPSPRSNASSGDTAATESKP